MKFTKPQLEQIIKEELDKLLQESFFAGDEEETAAAGEKQEVRKFRDITNATIENLKTMQAAWPALIKATQVRDRIKKRDGVSALSDLARRLNKLIQAMEKNLQLVVAGEEPLSEGIGLRGLAEDGVFGSEEARLARLAPMRAAQKERAAKKAASAEQAKVNQQKRKAEEERLGGKGPGFDKSTGYPDVMELDKIVLHSIGRHGDGEPGNAWRWLYDQGPKGYVSKNFDAFMQKFLKDTHKVVATIMDDLDNINVAGSDLPLA